MTNQRDQREALFAALSEGTMDPKRAEARAAALGLEPLTTPLDPGRYDPMCEPYWTLAMALAWIVWRTPDNVREFLPSWRRDHCRWFWREHRIHDGAGGYAIRAGWLWEPVYKGAAPMMSLTFTDSEVQPADARRMTVSAARLDLWEKLGADAIQASTVRNGAPYLIQAHEWPFLKHIEHRERDILRAGGDMFTPAVTYDANKILLQRKAVLAVWPADGPAAATPTLHDVIREIADAVVKPGMRATERNNAIRAVMGERKLTPACASTIKVALKGTRHIRSRGYSKPS